MSTRDIPARSIRFSPRTTSTLDSNPGTAGQVSYDQTNGTLRVAVGETLSNTLATQAWTDQELAALNAQINSSVTTTLTDYVTNTALGTTLESYLPLAGGILSGNLSLGGDLNITGSGRRIRGDFTDNIMTNRVAFQSSVTNGITTVFALPNGTANTTQFTAVNNSDPTNASLMQLAVLGSESSLRAGRTGTGTFLPMTFYAGGSERLRLSTTGNMGVGTAAPVDTVGRSLHLLNDADTGGTVASNAIVIIESINRNAVLSLAGSATASNSVTFGDLPGTASVASIVSEVANQNLYFRTGGTNERMRIDSAGRVLIGTTAVIGTAQAPLQVSASAFTGISFNRSSVPLANDSLAGIDAWANDSTASAVAATINFRAEENWSATNRGALIQFRTTAAGSGGAFREVARISSAGFLGVNTVTPPNRLSINSTIDVLGSQAQISHPAGDWGLVIKRVENDSGNANLALLKSRGERGALQQGDSIGRIGWHAVTGPSTTQFLAQIQVGNGNFDGTNADATMTFSTKSITSNEPLERVRIDANGDVGVGTSAPEARFQSNARSPYQPAITARSDTSAANWARIDWKNHNVVATGIIYLDENGTFAIRNDGAAPIAFYTSGANERMRIDASGRVAVGTTTLISSSLQTWQFDGGTLNTALNATAYGTTPSIVSRSAGGTAASPSATVNIPMNLVGSTTSDGTGFFNTIAIQGQIESTPTTGSHPTAITFATTSSGSTSRAERMRINSTGQVGINVSPTARLHITTSAADNTDGIRLNGGAVNKTVDLRPSMGSGSNNGIVAAGDSGIIFDGGTIGTGNFVIAPWSSVTSGMRMTADGSIGVGLQTPTLNTAGTVLHIHNSTASRGAVVHMTNAESGSAAANGLIVGKWSDGTNYFFDYNNFPIVLGTSGNERMRIDGTGRVTKPVQPGFYANGVAQNFVLGNQGDLVLANARYNIGNHYNTGNYRFTAPVAGRYLFTWSVFVNAVAGRCTLKLNGGAYFDLQMDVGNGMSQSAILNLNQGDFVTVGDFQNISGLNYWGSHSHFSGILLA